MNSALKNKGALETLNYVVKSQPERAGGRVQYDYQLYPGKLVKLNRRTGGDFRIIAIGDLHTENDFWNIPYKEVSKLLTEESLTHDRRWRFHIKQGSFVVFPGGRGQRIQVRVEQYHGAPLPISS